MKTIYIRCSILILLSIICLHLPAQINHVEPLNWFIGMKNPRLQLLVNGDEIGLATPSIQYPGVSIEKVHKANSKNYLFIDLIIQPNTKPGTVLIRFEKNGKTITTYPYSLLARKQAANQFKGFTAADVVYLIMPDRFANGDTNNDVIAGMKENRVNRSQPGGRHGGDIQGIIQHLDYIQQMGYTAIWCTPMLENNMAGYSYHGYSITNHYKVDPRYGTMEDYISLSAKAKEKGIKLIFDEVLNHCGSEHWWMKDLPFPNWINKADSFQLSTHRRTTNQDPYAAAYDKDLMTRGWFDKTMPDLNGENPYMANYLIQRSIWFTETLQLGGIRQDTYGYSNKKFLQQWSCRMMEEYPAFSMVGEEWSYNPLIESYWQKGKMNHDGYQSCLNTVMDFPLQQALTEGIREQEQPYASNGFTRMYEALANDFAYANPNQMLVFGDNHDMDRLFTQMKGDIALTKMAITYLLTIRGIPQFLYGTEILADNSRHLNDHGYIRIDFPGGWNGDSSNAFSGKGLTAEQLDMQMFMKKMLNWRKQHPAIYSGSTLHFAPFEGMYVYFRYNKAETLMVVMNRNTNATVLTTERFKEILANKKMVLPIFSDEKLSVSQPISIPGKSAQVFVIE
ncbi:MAG: alpha-amlyase [Sediminibacterium sp.]|nr:alpha-amlyase [Sediminibacterium sp.]